MLHCSSVTRWLRTFQENDGKSQSYVKMGNNSHWCFCLLNWIKTSRICNWETLQFSEESVSSVEPSLSTSILLLWWMFLRGEALLCTSFSAPTALPLLLLLGLTEIWAILDKEAKEPREKVNRAKGSSAKQHFNGAEVCFLGWDSHSLSSSWSISGSMSSSALLGNTPTQKGGEKKSIFSRKIKLHKV